MTKRNIIDLKVDKWKVNYVSRGIQVELEGESSDVRNVRTLPMCVDTT